MSVNSTRHWAMLALPSRSGMAVPSISMNRGAAVASPSTSFQVSLVSAL